MGVVPNHNSRKMLKKLVPLNLLPEGDLEQLLQTAVFKKDRAGTYLLRQGDTDYLNVYLLSGQVALLDRMKEVDRITADSEMAHFPLVHQIPRKNSVRAIGRVEYVLIDNRKLSELLVRASDDDYKVADLNSTISDDWMAQLLQSRVFQQIPPANIQGVIMRMEEVQVKRGQNVIEQGGEGDYFYLIHQGRCAVLRKEQGKKKPVELARLGPGNSFGEEALLSDSLRNSTVRMLANGVLLRLAKKDFTEFVKRPLAKGVSFREAEALLDKGAIWLDVRSLEQYEAGHLKNSISFPLETLRYQAPNLASDQRYVICCNDGQLSSTAAFLLTDRGFKVSVLEEGLRSAPSDILVKETTQDVETSAKVINLHSGVEIAGEAGSTIDFSELDDLRGKLAAANERIKELGIRFQGFRERQLRQEAQQQAEIKAQKVILDKSRERLDELRGKREDDRRRMEQLQEDSGDSNPVLKEALERLSQAKDSVIDHEATLKAEQESKQTICAERDDLKKQLDSSHARLEEMAVERDALEESIKELQKGQGDIEQKHVSALSDAEQQLEQLRNELDEAQNRYNASQSDLEQVRGSLQKAEAELEKQLALADLADNNEDQALRSEVISLNEALKEADFAYDEIREKAEVLSEEKEQIIKKMQELERSESVAKKQIDDLTAELEQLRTTKGSRTSIESEIYGDADEAEALREELRFVQLHSNTEIKELQDELQKAREQLEKKVDSRGIEKAKEEALRQELDELRKASQIWEQRVTESDTKCISLEDEIEDRDKQIDQARQELDEARTTYAEVETTLQQSEQALNQLREEVAARDLLAKGYVDPRLHGSDQTLHMNDIISGRSSGGAIAFWVLLGAVICFALLDGLMMFSGRGELITGLLQDGQVKQDEPKFVERNSPEYLRQTTRREVAANGGVTDTSPKITTETQETTDRPQPAWSVMTDISFGPAMVMLRGGSYTMGSNQNQVSGNEWPAHEVEIKTLAISQYEVTFDEYDRFAQSTGRPLPEDEGWGRGKRPVVNISWDDAVAYTEWLSERTGRKYRLPTEAEWEFAVRSGSSSIYWWGYQMEEGRANCFDCGSEWDRKSTAPVGSFSPNNFGLHDMAGNVREWILDCYNPSYSGASIDGSAWMEAECGSRVVRGGAYSKTSDSMRSTWRGHFKPDSRFPYTGFRVVSEP